MIPVIAATFGTEDKDFLRNVDMYGRDGINIYLAALNENNTERDEDRTKFELLEAYANKLEDICNNPQMGQEIRKNTRIAILSVFSIAISNINDRIRNCKGLLNGIDEFGQFLFDFNKIAHALDIIIWSALGEELITDEEDEEIRSKQLMDRDTLISIKKQIELVVRYNDRCQEQGTPPICNIDNAMYLAKWGILGNLENIDTIVMDATDGEMQGLSDYLEKKPKQRSIYTQKILDRMKQLEEAEYSNNTVLNTDVLINDIIPVLIRELEKSMPNSVLRTYMGEDGKTYVDTSMETIIETGKDKPSDLSETDIDQKEQVTSNTEQGIQGDEIEGNGIHNDSLQQSVVQRIESDITTKTDVKSAADRFIKMIKGIKKIFSREK